MEWIIFLVWAQFIAPAALIVSETKAPWIFKVTAVVLAPIAVCLMEKHILEDALEAQE